MPFAATRPAVVKFPPTYSAVPKPSSNAARDSTRANGDPLTPSLPGGPSVVQLAPSHLAILRLVSPAIHVKFPPTKSAGPPPSSKAARELAQLFVMLPGVARADQLAPFHRATLFASMPPASENDPAA